MNNETWLLCVKYMEIDDIVALSMTNTHLRALLSPIIWDFYNHSMSHRQLFVLWGYRPWLFKYNEKYRMEYRFIAGIFTSLDNLIRAYQQKLIEYFHLYLTIDKYCLCYYDITCVCTNVPFAIPGVSKIINITESIMSHVNDCLNDFDLIDYHIEHETRDYIITNFKHLNTNVPCSSDSVLNTDIIYLRSYSNSYYHDDTIEISYSKRKFMNLKNAQKGTLSLEKQLHWSLLLFENIYRVPLNIL